MAYDPKSYLDQALKTGFQQTYIPPVSPMSGDGTYDAPVATFGDVQVRPLTELVGQTAQDIGTPQQTGYAVSRPLQGGYFENSIFDNDGKFLRTTISEPDNDKYGLKSLAQLGLMAASFGGLGPIASAAANAYKGVQAAKSGDILGAAASILPGAGYIPGIDPEFAKSLKTVGGYAKTGSALQKAIENKDILGALGAASDIPGVPKVPGEITDVLKGVGQANRIREAVRNEDPYAIFREIVGASKTGVGPKKLADITGEDAIEGFFDEGGEGYVDPNAGNLPSWALDPYKTETKPGEYYAGLDKIIDEWDEALYDIIPNTYDTAPKTSMTPMEMNRFLEANVEDPAEIEKLLQEYYPDTQSVSVTGKRDTTPDYTLEDLMPGTGRSTSDQYTEVPDRTPGTPLNTPPDEDRTVGTTPGTDKTTKPGTKTTTKPTSTTTTRTMPTGGGPTVHNPLMFQGPAFDLNSFFRLAQENQMSPEDLLQILRG